MPAVLNDAFNVTVARPIDTRMEGTSSQTAGITMLAPGITRYETNTGKFMVNTASNSAAWKRIPILTSGNGGKKLGVKSDGTDWEFKDDAIPAEYLTQTEGDARYLQSFTIPSEYLTQTDGDVRYATASALTAKQDLIQHGTRLSASLVGSSNIAPANAVTDQEFAYLSGLTGNIEARLNSCAYPGNTVLQGVLDTKLNKDGSNGPLDTTGYVRAAAGLFTKASSTETVGWKGGVDTPPGMTVGHPYIATHATSQGTVSGPSNTEAWRIYTDHGASKLRGMKSTGLYVDTHTTGGHTGYIGLYMGKPSNNFLWAYVSKFHVGNNRYEMHQINTYGGFASDDRIKYHEQPISSALSVVRQLQPKKYRKHSRMMTEEEERAMEADPDAELPDESVEHDGKTVYMHCPKHEAGFIAQDVLQIPELAHAVEQNTDGPMKLQYNDVFTYAVAAIKELDALVSTLRTTVKQQTTQISSLQRRIQALES